jgi:hypothetical protein
MYKSIFARIMHLVIKPQIEWQAIDEESRDQAEVLSSFALPLMGLAAFISFLSQLIARQGTLTSSLQYAAAVFVALIASVYAAYHTNLKLFNKSHSIISTDQWFTMVAYASGIFCMAQAVASALNATWAANPALLLTALAVWHWANTRFEKPSQTPIFVVIATIVSMGVSHAIVWWIFSNIAAI